MEGKRCQIRECPLWRMGPEVPFDRGKKDNIFWMGESPGKWEERKGRPFCPEADAGGLLRVCLKEAGLAYEDHFFGNAARCRIDKDSLTTKEITQILSCCRVNAIAPIRMLKPKVIVAMGDFALRQITRRSGITKHRGRWIQSKEFPGSWILPVFHPAYICRNMGLKERLVRDFVMVRDFIKNKYHVPRVDESRIAGYKEVNSIEPFLKRWRKEKETVSFDTEDQGLDWMDPNFLLISYSVSPAPGTGYDIILYEEVGYRNSDFSIIWPRKGSSKKHEPTTVWVRRAKNFDEKLQVLANFLEDENIKKVMMHGNHDLHAVDALCKREKRKPIEVRNYRIDIQAAANVYDENLFRGKTTALESLQMFFTDIKEDYKAQFQKKYDPFDMLAVPKKDRTEYAVGDADSTRRVAISLREGFSKPENYRLARYIAKFTMPALGFLRTLETNGALIDKKKLPVVSKEVYKEMIAAEDRALGLIPDKVLQDFEITPAVIREARKAEKFLLTRDELVAEVLFGRNGFDLEINGEKPLTKGKENWTVAKPIRIRLLDQEGIPDEAVEFIGAYDEFSEDHTMYSRYLKGFEKHIKIDGRIHTSYTLAFTVTGRTSSSNPNMENNPKKSKQAQRIRELICAPPGYVLVAADEGQSELRWAAELSGDEELMRIFINHLDPHAEVALDLLRRKNPSWTLERWNKLPKVERDLWRRSAKCTNFGLLFGMAVRGFVRYAKNDYGLDISKEEGQSWINTWFARFPRIRGYQEGMVRIAQKQGYVESVLGRRRRLPDIHSRDSLVRGEAERQAMNQPVQSPSSDVVLLAGSEIMKRKPKYQEAHPVLFNHDENVFEVQEDKVDKWAKIIKEEMEHPPLERDFNYKMKVPLMAEASVGKNLADMHSMS